MNAGGNYNRPKVVNSNFEFTRIGTIVDLSKHTPDYYEIINSHFKKLPYFTVM